MTKDLTSLAHGIALIKSFKSYICDETLKKTNRLRTLTIRVTAQVPVIYFYKTGFW